ncbi:hypothetical protein OCU04_001917 [Sclerotinia nivalis]|uniref:Uncharacterized protein n=1 Tax=Sclerotinia nivalis TaxID=352851 RepID=A0A9X0AZ27_9HELO|nr:hypothetical protein OCU04_001917 [Sclerotinia nivalis]
MTLGGDLISSSQYGIEAISTFNSISCPLFLSLVHTCLSAFPPSRRPRKEKLYGEQKLKDATEIKTQSSTGIPIPSPFAAAVERAEEEELNEGDEDDVEEEEPDEEQEEEESDDEEESEEVEEVRSSAQNHHRTHHHPSLRRRRGRGIGAPTSNHSSKTSRHSKKSSRTDSSRRKGKGKRREKTRAEIKSKSKRKEPPALWKKVKKVWGRVTGSPRRKRTV